MYKKMIEDNKRHAFEHFVSVIKKQNPVTIEIEEDIFSYTTKKGVTKRYKYFNNIKDAIKSGYKIERVNSLIFGEIK